MSDKLREGDVFKVKQTDKTRSPYQRVTKVLDAKSAECEGIEETGNRRLRRIIAKAQRTKK